jgi:hypothetical protein
MPAIHEKSCDNCCRPMEQKSLTKMTKKNLVAYLCTTCHYVYTNEQNTERFENMIQQKTFEQSNMEMKKVHNMLSALLVVGFVFCLLIVAAMLPQISDAVPTVDYMLTTLKHSFHNFMYYIKISL